jgi:hypothetical protein
VIKRITLATRRPTVAPGQFAEAWTSAVADALDAPEAVRPIRAAISTVVAELTPDAAHDGVALEWFADEGALAGYESWCGTRPAATDADLDTTVVVVDEVVLRGGDWLDRYWRAGASAAKHVALARRASGLSSAEFSERWRQHAGRAGGSANAGAIPESVRGCAYVQDHPRPRVEGEWAYDAVNEVYLEDLDALRARIDWFREAGVGSQPDELFGSSRFLAVREEVLR